MNTEKAQAIQKRKYTDTQQAYEKKWSILLSN